MHLLGVVKSVAALSSRLAVGSTAGRWIIEEFTAQMRAVSKIALQRRSNLATFLEMNGIVKFPNSPCINICLSVPYVPEIGTRYLLKNFITIMVYIA
jgi:hypothetical protein